MAVLDFLTKAIEPVTDLIDNLNTSEEERINAKTQLNLAQNTIISEILDYERQKLKAQADVIMTEAKGESWLQRNWRPATMLTFVGLVVAHWLGFTAENLSEDQILSLMGLVKIGLGGYVVGRSAEKIMKEYKRDK